MTIRPALLLGLVLLANAPASILDPAAVQPDAFKAEQGTAVSITRTGDAPPAIRIDFPGENSYPGVDLPGAPWNLATHTGIEAEIANIGKSRLNINLRADNPGDWQQSPWNTNNSWIDPGETQTVRLAFGQSFGRPGYALDPSRVSNIKIFADRPGEESAILVKSVRPFGADSAPNTPAEPPPAAADGSDATFSPPISGELIDLTHPAPLDGFNHADSSAIIEDGKIKVTFQAGASYPNIRFPIPDGGWNLSAFGGVNLTVTNPHDRKITAHLRVDNPGDWRTEPWNTEGLAIDPGETKTISLSFGLQNGAPAFPLNPARISGIQLFIIRPAEATTLILSDLRAAGSPSATTDETALTNPGDRNIPVTPPSWLGTRPPVEGEWTQTLDENFDGDRLDEKIWTPRFPWDGPQPGQLQRYAPENVVIADGVAALVVEKRGGHENNDPRLDSRDYTSGLIQSYDKWSQRYGYFEARVKLPAARGLWPAFWMMPDRGRESGLDTWQRRDTGDRHGKGMEIDILEHLTEWKPGRNNVATHWDGYGPDHKHWGTSHVYFGPTPDGWHAFGLLWEPGKLTWYIDGRKVVEWENDRITDVPAYLKLNIQLGGWATRDVDDGALPDRMLVDYVRAWQLRERLQP